MTPELIDEMILQSAADGAFEEAAEVEVEVELADAAADVAAAEVGVELADELDELQPAIRAPPAASMTRTESDERLDIKSLHGGGTLRCIS